MTKSKWTMAKITKLTNQSKMRMRKNLKEQNGCPIKSSLHICIEILIYLFSGIYRTGDRYFCKNSFNSQVI